MKDLMDMVMPLVTTIYGKPGSGKTTVSASYPKPILYLSVKDKGSESAKTPELKRGEIKVLEVTSFEESLEFLDYALRTTDKWGSVILDHMTALQEQSYDKVKDDEGKTKMTQPMYGTASGYMKEIIEMMVELADSGVEPVFICQDRTDSGEGDGDDQLMPEVGPNLMPKLATYLGAASRIIIHTYPAEAITKTGTRVERKIEYRVRTGPNPYYITKLTRPAGSPCPAYLVNDLDSGNGIYDQLKAIVAGDWKEPSAPKPKKKKTSGSSRSRRR